MTPRVDVVIATSTAQPVPPHSETRQETPRTDVAADAKPAKRRAATHNKKARPAP